MVTDEEFLEEDPEGLTYFLATAFLGYWQWATMSALWPGQAPLTACYDDDIGPNWAAFTSTAWYTATSTKFTSTLRFSITSKEPSSTLAAQPASIAATESLTGSTTSTNLDAKATTPVSFNFVPLLLETNSIPDIRSHMPFPDPLKSGYRENKTYC